MNDTPDFMYQKQLEIIYSKTPAERFMMGIEMCRGARKMVEAGILQENPNISDEHLNYMVFTRYYPSLVAETETSWQMFFLRKKITDANNFDQIKGFYDQFIQKFPFEPQNTELEKNYYFLFMTLLEKVNNQNDLDFVQNEIKHLDLSKTYWASKLDKNLERTKRKLGIILI